MIKENEAIKNRIIRDIRNPFEHEEKNIITKQEQVILAWSNNYI